MTEYDVTDAITPLDAAVKDGCSATMVEIPFSESYTDPSGCTVNADGYEKWIKLSLKNGWSFREFGYHIDGVYTGWYPNNYWSDHSIHYLSPKAEQLTDRTNEDDSTSSTSSLFYPEGRDDATVSAEVLSACQRMARFVYDDSFEEYMNYGRYGVARGLLVVYSRLERKTEETDIDTMLDKLPFLWSEHHSINYIKLRKSQTLTISTNPSRKRDLGTITGGGNHDVYTPVTLTATPNAGYRFLYWAEKYYAGPNSIISRDNPYTFTMPTDPTTIYAHFDGVTPGIVYNPLVSGNPIAFRRRLADDPAFNPYPIIAR